IDYQVMDTLQEYVLINTKRRRIDCFRRNEQGLWVLQFYSAEQDFFRLYSVDFEATIAEVYEDVVF
ncbi:Uma2 family endonuclease, partial [Chrysosporum bergii ANA360D]